MSQLQSNEITDTETADPRWKDLYKIGGVTAIIEVIIPLLAVIAFFIWPYTPGFTSTESVFTAIQNDRLGGLMALDFFLLVGILFSIPLFLALYVALKRVNESYALIALAFGLISVVSIIPARPIAELFTLSDLHAATATDVARSHYLAAGEALLALFNGTAWLVCMFFNAVSFLISSFLMLRSNIFSKATAYVGVIVNTSTMFGLLPVIGLVFLFLATLGGIIWCILLARGFFQLERQSRNYH